MPGNKRVTLLTRERDRSSSNIFKESVAVRGTETEKPVERTLFLSLSLVPFLTNTWRAKFSFFLFTSTVATDLHLGTFSVVQKWERKKLARRSFPFYFFTLVGSVSLE